MLKDEVKKTLLEPVGEISDIVDRNRDTFIRISDALWEFAETKYEEFQSSELLCETLEQEGFLVERGIAGMETAFVGTFGSGSPVLAILGEYDALSGLSQSASTPERSPLVQGGNGHGCGHNLFGAGSLAGAVALRRYMTQNHVQGTIRFYGCPAEEGGSGKAYMARAGVFDDVDVSLAWHPGTAHGVMITSTLANSQVLFKFTGQSSHAAVNPHLGRSALDAVELMNVGVNYLREHVRPNTRISYAITDTGGTSPNVVQGQAAVLYLIRAPQISEVNQVYERVCNVAKGAAMMTGTEVEIVFDKACSNLIPNNTLERIVYQTMVAIPVPEHDANEHKLAQSFAATLPQNAKADEFRFLKGMGDEGQEAYEHLMDRELADVVLPYAATNFVAPVSSDVGDVSWIVPTVQFTTACWTLGTPAHSWQAVSQGTTSVAHKGMLYAAKVLACTALEILQNSEVAMAARAELQKRLGNETYVCPIPRDVKPPRASLSGLRV
ncbi:MAG: amidohydrolase [Alicyclobacillus sp. RIFOXYA1_FULL_53_8]|nr:MAG: amidohydrolase [Alicyclobacillus sp. RIFOXYA1_FULL_53_8]